MRAETDHFFSLETSEVTDCVRYIWAARIFERKGRNTTPARDAAVLIHTYLYGLCAEVGYNERVRRGTAGPDRPWLGLKVMTSKDKGGQQQKVESDEKEVAVDAKYGPAAVKPQIRQNRPMDSTTPRRGRGRLGSSKVYPPRGMWSGIGRGLVGFVLL